MTDDLPETLRIIATETRLSAGDRAMIIQTAIHVEELQRTLTETQRELIEANGRRVAATERLLELQPPVSWRCRRDG